MLVVAALPPLRVVAALHYEVTLEGHFVYITDCEAANCSNLTLRRFEFELGGDDVSHEGSK